jgi:hypothetical protein
MTTGKTDRSRQHELGRNLWWWLSCSSAQWGENDKLRQELIAEYKRTGEKPFEFVSRKSLEASTESLAPTL